MGIGLVLALVVGLASPLARASEAYVINVGSSQLELSGPEIACPAGLDAARACFDRGTGSFRELIIDPGHDDSPASKRNFPTKNFYEGRSNMATSLLVAELLDRCLGIDPQRIHFVRLPGERYYFEYADPATAHVSLSVLEPRQLDKRVDAINALVRQTAGSRTFMLSIHANSIDNPKELPDRVEVYLGPHASSADGRAAASMKDAVVAGTLGAYRAGSTAALAHIRSEVTRGSGVQHAHLAVIGDRVAVGRPDTLKMLVERFYMDGSQSSYLDRESDLTGEEGFRLDVSLRSGDGPSTEVATYPLTRLDLASAQGIVAGIAKIVTCP